MSKQAFEISRRNLLASGAAFASVQAFPARYAWAQTSTLTVGLQGLPDSLVMGFSSFAASNLAMQTQDPLVARTDAGDLVPGLALSWRAVDPETWRFELRRKVKFHDGKPFTGADVKFTLDYS